MSKEQMRAAIERAKQPPAPPRQQPTPVRTEPKAKAKTKKPKAPFVKFRLPAGTTFTFQQPTVGQWRGVLSGTNADGTTFSYEMMADGVHRLLRELGKKWRAEHGAKEATA